MTDVPPLSDSASKWRLPTSPFENLAIIKSTATSVGDAMRDLDSRDVIVSDFILVFGDLVSNVVLEPVLAKHRARREKDKNAIMTMVLREVETGHRLRSRGRLPTFVLDRSRNRCLHYEESGPRGGKGHSLLVDADNITGYDALEIRADLIDCNVDICTPDVLSLWSDNFDYTTLRRSFLYGVLKDHELNGKTIHTHIISDGYASRARNLKMYGAISRDVLSRRTYPFCPDGNFVEGQGFQLSIGNVFKEDGVRLSRSCEVTRRVVLGRETSVDGQSFIAESIIGRRCQIGNNVNVSGSYIWNDVTVGDGSSIDQAVIADGAVIGRKCIIESGALISFGVRVADGTVVSRNSSITQKRSEAQGKSDKNDWTSGGEGDNRFQRKVDSDDDESDVSSMIGDLNSHFSHSESSLSEFSESESDPERQGELSRRDSLASEISMEAAPNRDFLAEETANVLDGLQNQELPENIFLELNARRMGVNASQHEVRQVVATAFMRRISNVTDTENQARKGIREAVNELFKKYQELIKRVIFDKDQEQKMDQVDLLLLVQKEATGNRAGDSLLLFVAKELYDLELVDEDGILQWWEDARSKDGDMAKVRTLTEQFITFLQEAEEEEGSEESEEA